MVEIQLVHYLAHEWTNSVLTGYPYFTSRKYVPYMNTKKTGFTKIVCFCGGFSGYLYIYMVTGCRPMIQATAASCDVIQPRHAFAIEASKGREHGGRDVAEIT